MSKLCSQERSARYGACADAGRSSRTSVLQEIIYTFGFSVPEAITAFGTIYELMCGPRGIAAAVDAKNMPPACFLYAPTVLQEIIGISAFSEATLLGGFFFTNIKNTGCLLTSGAIFTVPGLPGSR